MVCILMDAHEKIVGFDVMMDIVVIMDIFNAGDLQVEKKKNVCMQKDVRVCHSPTDLPA
jgi:hypothetical protein